MDTAEQVITDNQEESIIRLCRANKNTVVILQNGAPIDMTAWIDYAPAVIEAWYPGEQGAKALAEILFGETNPSAKLPITVPKSAGQLPLNYSYKPSGRGYAYCDNDGSPLYPFGYGLSYTSFEIKDAALSLTDNTAAITFVITNTGCFDGVEVVQVYLGSRNCEVVRLLKELVAYRRIRLAAGESRKETISVDADAFAYYGADMKYGIHGGIHTLMLGTSSDDITAWFDLKTENGKLVSV